MISSIPLAKPCFPREDIDQVKSDVEAILESGLLTLGDYTRRFEEEYANLHGARQAIAVSSGTSAIDAALWSINLSQEDEIIVPATASTSAVAAVFFAGGKPVLADVNPDTFTLDLQTVTPKLTQKTRGILLSHIGGLVSPDTPELAKLTRDSKMFLLEDAAHAQGSSYQGMKAGSFGDVGAFSFRPTEVVAMAQGGMVTTNDDALADRCRAFRNQGEEVLDDGTVIELGSIWRMDEMSAAIGILQLKRLDWMIAVRNGLAGIYDGGLAKIPGIKPQKRFDQSVNNYYRYTAMLEKGIDRDALELKLQAKGIRCGGEAFSPPLHLQPAYQKFLGVKAGDFPVAEEAWARMLNLPMYVTLKEEEARYVVETIQQALA